MKLKKIIFLTTIIFLLNLSYSLSIVQKSEKATQNQIQNLSRIFGDTFIKSLYSIDELKPFAIIQLEKTIKIYENKWISPNEITKLLNNKEKSRLINSVEEYINTLNSDNERNKIINKIRLWCISDNQLNLMINNMQIGKLRVLHLIAQHIPTIINTNTGEIISQENESGNIDYYYFMVLNQISKLTLKEQFKLYSDIFGQLAQQ